MSSDIDKHKRWLRDIGGRTNLEALSAIEALEAEVAFVKGQLAGTNKNIAGWLQSRDDNLRRAEFAEAQLDEALSGCRETNSRAEAAEARAEKMREALVVAREAAGERRSYCQAWEWKYKAQWDEEDAAISKALEGSE
ncbi:MAG: hypothetical protein E6Q97_15770 [Desulfurellales bacterium]|nr:MAG: hypothetical protein E6Q97_15770 [Desulfurellales bacterium]